MKKVKLLLYTLVILSTSCTLNADKVSQTDLEIMSKVIDDFTLPNLPPPKIGSSDSTINKSLLDSMFNKSMVVGLYPKMNNKIDMKFVAQIPKSYGVLVDTTIGELTLKDITQIDNGTRHTVVLADTSLIKLPGGIQNFEVLYHFTRIWYNKDGTRAIFEVGTSKSRLNGSSVIYCMRKNSGNWELEYSIPTSIW